MEATTSEKRESVVEGGKKKKRSAGKFILNFLMYGGWLAVLIVGMAIYVAVSVSSN